MAGRIDTLVLSVAWNGTGTAPANSVLVVPVGEYASFGLELTGSFTDPIIIEGTFDGATWFNANCLNIDKSAGTNSLSGAGRRLIQSGPLVELRVRRTANTSAAAQATLTGSLSGV